MNFKKIIYDLKRAKAKLTSMQNSYALTLTNSEIETIQSKVVNTLSFLSKIYESDIDTKERSFLLSLRDDLEKLLFSIDHLNLLTPSNKELTIYITLFTRLDTNISLIDSKDSFTIKEHKNIPILQELRSSWDNSKQLLKEFLLKKIASNVIDKREDIDQNVYALMNDELASLSVEDNLRFMFELISQDPNIHSDSLKLLPLDDRVTLYETRTRIKENEEKEKARKEKGSPLLIKIVNGNKEREYIQKTEHTKTIRLKCPQPKTFECPQQKGSQDDIKATEKLYKNISETNLNAIIKAGKKRIKDYLNYSNFIDEFSSKNKKTDSNIKKEAILNFAKEKYPLGFEYHNNKDWILIFRKINDSELPVIKLILLPSEMKVFMKHWKNKLEFAKVMNINTNIVFIKEDIYELEKEEDD